MNILYIHQLTWTKGWQILSANNDSFSLVVNLTVLYRKTKKYTYYQIIYEREQHVHGTCGKTEVGFLVMFLWATPTRTIILYDITVEPV